MKKTYLFILLSISLLFSQEHSIWFDGDKAYAPVNGFDFGMEEFTITTWIKFDNLNTFQTWFSQAHF